MSPVRRFLLLAAAWDLAVGSALIALPAARFRAPAPGPRARESGVVVLAFGVLYAVAAARPTRGLLIFSTVAKIAGGASGIAALLRGRRDAVAFAGLADTAWVPGFVLAARTLGRCAAVSD